jgi:hypothetical protein
MRSPIEGILACLAALIAALPASAHHGSAMYQDREINVRGVVTKVAWVNPHIYISVETGEGVVWMIEGSPPAVMRSNGWTPESIVAGDAVLVRARPHTNANRKMALGRSLSKADGTQLVFSSNNPGSVASQAPVTDVVPEFRDGGSRVGSLRPSRKGKEK